MGAILKLPFVVGLYHVPVHSLAQRVLAHIQRQDLLKAGDRVGVAVSGGIDSVALLRLLLELRPELGIVLSVVHFNHKLRGSESDGDEQFVASLAHEHGLEFYCERKDVRSHAKNGGLEGAARELRYGFFGRLIGRDAANEPEEPKPLQARLDKIATGHTLDDQAETVLMRVIRGAGLRGLGGIHPRLAVEDDDGDLHGEIVRPLLGVRRRELESYLEHIGQSWREDESNLDERFTRNRVRKLVLPLLEREFNPSIAENLTELAEIARGEEDYWENEVAGWMGTGVHWAEPEWARSTSEAGALVQIGPNSKNPAFTRGGPSKELQAQIDEAPWLVANASVDRLWFLGEPAAVQRRIVKAIGDRAGIPLEFRHVEEILRFAIEEGPGAKELSLPLGWKVLRQTEELVFVTPDLREPIPVQDYEYQLSVPSEFCLHELGVTIELRRVPANEMAGYNPKHLLDAESLPGPLRVRNWRAGDRFWPAHTKSPKKIKELLQERHVSQPERKLWPVVLAGDEIVWMRGFPAPARFRAQPEREAILLIEKRGDSNKES
jgi:tRNA(Ile)-lysidine synthase